jgi:glycerol-3-phosphate dehydrogenase
LCGTRTASLLVVAPPHELLPDTDLPYSLVRWSVEHEWARTVGDLVERRLMLLYHQRLTRSCLARLADALVEAGLMSAPERAPAVAAEVERLKTRYGKHVE